MRPHHRIRPVPAQSHPRLTAENYLPHHSLAIVGAKARNSFQSVQYSRSRPIEPSKNQAINVAERQSLRGFAPQHVELMSKDKDLRFQRSPRPEQPDQGAPDQ